MTDIELLNLKQDMRIKIGRQLKEARNKAGLSQRGLAAICGLQPAHIGRIELGKYSVTIDTLSVICNALNIQLELL